MIGHVPSELGDLTGLTKLAVYNNQLSGYIPCELGRLGVTTRLASLRLDYNKFSGTLPSEMGNTRLAQLVFMFFCGRKLPVHPQ